MSTPYPVRIEKGHVVMSDGTVLSPYAIRELVKSLGKRNNVSETYPVTIDKKKGVITNNSDRLDAKLLGALSNASKHVTSKKGSKFDAYGRYKRHFENYHDYANDSVGHGKPPHNTYSPPLRESYEHGARYADGDAQSNNTYDARYDDYLDKKSNYDNRSLDYQTSNDHGADYYNKMPYGFDTTPSPFHSTGSSRNRYFPVTQAYGGE
jgi:hypothetical protein